MSEYVALTPGFAKPAVGSVVKVEAVDWGAYTEQTPREAEYTIVRGTIYGEVIACDDAQIVVAFQVFFDDTVRGVLAVPWVTVQRVTVLEAA